MFGNGQGLNRKPCTLGKPFDAFEDCLMGKTGNAGNCVVGGLWIAIPSADSNASPILLLQTLGSLRSRVCRCCVVVGRLVLRNISQREVRDEGQQEAINSGNWLTIYLCLPYPISMCLQSQRGDVLFTAGCHAATAHRAQPHKMRCNST